MKGLPEMKNLVVAASLVATMFACESNTENTADVGDAYADGVDGTELPSDTTVTGLDTVAPDVIEDAIADAGDLDVVLVDVPEPQDTTLDDNFEPADVVEQDTTPVDDADDATPTDIADDATQTN